MESWVLDHLRRSRKGRGMTIQALSKELGVNRFTMSEYERGVRVCRAGFLFRWAEAVGLRLGFVVVGD